MTDEELVALAVEMAKAFNDEGKGLFPAMPKSWRDRVMIALPQLMFSERSLKVYSNALTDELKKRGRQPDVPWHEAPWILDGLVHKIVANGFECLSTDELAFFAFSPPVLVLLRTCICYDLQQRLPGWAYRTLVTDKRFD